MKPLDQTVGPHATIKTHKLDGTSQVLRAPDQGKSKRPSQLRKAVQQASMTTGHDASSLSNDFKMDNVSRSRLMIRANGFKGIYNESFPLDILNRSLAA